jgi:hypothetical protein
MNNANAGFGRAAGTIMVTLDHAPVALPAGRHSLTAIRSYLETLALAKQRVLAVFAVNGSPMDPALPPVHQGMFNRIDAATIRLEELPLLLLTTAGQQADRARESVETALTLVLINKPPVARELWWKIACQLKEPVLTLSLMPEDLCRLNCGTTFHKLRRWQLEQIAAIVRKVDGACDAKDNIKLSDALEQLVLPWLQSLSENIRLWHDATLAGTRLATKSCSL